MEAARSNAEDAGDGEDEDPEEALLDMLEVELVEVPLDILDLDEEIEAVVVGGVEEVCVRLFRIDVTCV